ncbi:MAG TPA: CPBP family intramembrane glutamic endopeptidase [Thermoanaerobaculia bacterium]|nr:CPBP family intramembrane glutamic endopeptidase [Thermoanaerobaculia bacterium]
MALAPPPLAPLSLLLRLLGPAVLALAAAWAFDRLCQRKGLLPPGFYRPWRRAAAGALVFLILWFGIFAPIGEVGLDEKLDLSAISTPRLFLLHGMMAAAVLGWFLLGFAGARRPRPAAPAAAAPLEAPADSVPAPAPTAAMTAAVRQPSFFRQVAAQLGLVAPDVPREVLIGLALGACAWGAVLLALFAAAIAIYAIGGEQALPKPSAIVPWIAALPVLVRLLVSLSAGFVEEIFFRGFLQPRAGIALSTGCFVLAHLSYGQPFMLLGIAMLSLIYAFLVRWRQTIWPAIAAHALFDGVQLLVIIPMAMRYLGPAPGHGGGKPAMAVFSGVAGALGRIW